MRRFLDLMKVSAVGAILLSALAACNSKPESNPTPPPSDDDCVEVIIEQVVDGKLVDTRAVGRTDVVKYTGKTDGEDVIQVRWPDDVKNTTPFDFSVYAKPNCYLNSINYRFDQESEYQSLPITRSTFRDKEELQLIGSFTCDPSGSNKVYVNIDYEEVSKDDYLLTYSNNPSTSRPAPVPPGSGVVKPKVYVFSDAFSYASFYPRRGLEEVLPIIHSKRCEFTFEPSPYIKDVKADDDSFRVEVVDPPTGKTFALKYNVKWVFEDPFWDFSVQYEINCFIPES